MVINDLILFNMQPEFLALSPHKPLFGIHFFVF